MKRCTGGATIFSQPSTATCDFQLKCNVFYFSLIFSVSKNGGTGLRPDEEEADLCEGDCCGEFPFASYISCTSFASYPVLLLPPILYFFCLSSCNSYAFYITFFFCLLSFTSFASYLVILLPPVFFFICILSSISLESHLVYILPSIMYFCSLTL